MGFQADWPDSVPRARSLAGRGPAAAASRECWSKRLRRARGGRGPGREIATPPLGVEQTETGVGSVGVQEIWQGVQRGAKPTIAFSYIKICIVFS